MPDSLIDYKNRTQVAVSTTATSATSIAYTVPAGEVFVLTAFTMGISGSGTGKLNLSARDEVDATQWCFGTMAQKTTILESNNANASFRPGVKIPAGWDIVLVSDSANIDGCCFIHGYLEG